MTQSNDKPKKNWDEVWLEIYMPELSIELSNEKESKRRGTRTVPGTRSSEGEAGRHPRTMTGPKASADTTQREDFEPPTVQSQLDRIATQARQYPEMAFTTLAHLMDVAMLEHAFHRLNPQSAPGVDRVTWRKYQRNLTTNLEELHQKLVNQTYEPQPVRRQQIPKGKGKFRSLGIPAMEDKIAAKAVQLLLEQIYEQDFSSSSYGFRPGRSCHDALRDLRQGLLRMGVSHVIDCDISAFFDNIQHKQLLAIVKKRVKDGAILRLIKLWLKAGIMDGRELVFPTKGSPQGSVISPLLANIYLHEILDQWIEHDVSQNCRGQVLLIRYADDFIIGCSHPADVARLQSILPGRFAKYGLTIHPEKTQVVGFKRPPRRPTGSPDDPPGTFTFLGFTHFWAGTKKGNTTLKRKAQASRLARFCASIWQWCRSNRHRCLKAQFATLCSKLRGAYQYYGLPCNWDCLDRLRYATIRAWRYWLNRRGGRAMTWKQFSKIMERFVLPIPKITQPNV